MSCGVDEKVCIILEPRKPEVPTLPEPDADISGGSLVFSLSATMHPSRTGTSGCRSYWREPRRRLCTQVAACVAGRLCGWSLARVHGPRGMLLQPQAQNFLLLGTTSRGSSSIEWVCAWLRCCMVAPAVAVVTRCCCCNSTGVRQVWRCRGRARARSEGSCATNRCPS